MEFDAGWHFDNMQGPEVVHELDVFFLKEKSAD
jgi:hypothetical protein